MRSNIIIQSRSIEAVYNEVMEYLLAKYFTPPEHVVDPAYGASAEAWYEAGGDFYEAEARLEAQSLGYTLLPDGSYHPHRRV